MGIAAVFKKAIGPSLGSIIMRVAILYICTGRYSIFWDSFFRSCESRFLRDHEKHYFVFTESKILHEENSRVHRIVQHQLGWPDDTLKRFHMFQKIESCLEQSFHFVVFFNANCLFTEIIGEEFLPTKEEGLVMVRHPGNWWKPSFLFPYERRSASSAHIAYGQGAYYVCGGINGGWAPDYIAFIRALRSAVDQDERHGIVARWHDESHINRYIVDIKCKILHPGYAVPDGRNLPFTRKIRLIDKRSVGGHDYMRGISQQKSKTLKERFVFRPSFPKVQVGKPVVLARLVGGMGNQMFIYATAFGLAKRLNAELALDTGALQSDAMRHYELHNFGIMAPQWRVPKYVDKLLGRLFSFSKKVGFGKEDWTYVACPKAYSSCLENVSGNVYLTGYWQCAKYFAGYEEDLRNVLKPVPALSSELQAWELRFKEQSTVFVHLRRGDYTTPGNLQRHGVLSLEYYDNARLKMEKNGIHAQYAIFSDDPEEAKRLFRHWDNVIFPPQSSPIVHMYLMSRCEHAIIANSSFSWWAAWLGKTERQCVVAPKQWFATGVEPPFAVSDLYLPDWEIL